MQEEHEDQEERVRAPRPVRLGRRSLRQCSSKTLWPNQLQVSSSKCHHSWNSLSHRKRLALAPLCAQSWHKRGGAYSRVASEADVQLFFPQLGPMKETYSVHFLWCHQVPVLVCSCSHCVLRVKAIYFKTAVGFELKMASLKWIIIGTINQVLFKCRMSANLIVGMSLWNMWFHFIFTGTLCSGYYYPPLFQRRKLELIEAFKSHFWDLWGQSPWVLF